MKNLFSKFKESNYTRPQFYLKTLRNNYPIIILLTAIIAVFITNFSPSTFIIGWDNRLQELNPVLNLKRYIFSVWQEYQGLGLLAGHAHASEITHALFMLFLSLILPLNMVRQIFVFLMLLLGPIGMYILIKKLVHYDLKALNEAVPLFGGLFYLFNLVTIQTFYTPLEPFIIQYAFLPWLFLSSLNLIANKTKKSFLFFILINVLAIPQAQIPTVFFVYIFSLCFFLLVLILETKNKDIIRSSLKILLTTLVINAFWLLPFIYFYLTNSQVAFEAKINQMSTQTIFLQNKEFGDIQDVMLLKGFWFNNVDPNLQGKFVYMFSIWKEHLNPLVSSIGYLFFLVILLGFAYIKRKAPFAIPFSALFIFAFTMLATNTPPFSWIDSLMRNIPVLNEIFRFSFTKFSILALLTYSFFFSIGIGKLILIILNFLKRDKQVYYSIGLLFIVLLAIFIFPIFKGGLFYNKERLQIPNNYFALFNSLKAQNPNMRIANLPQPNFWGWTFYNWGYGGSGFIWYGINQPILDRAFDVWSRYDENYYWELSYALYSKNPGLFEDVLNKYQINYLLVDKNIINPSSPKALFIPETQSLLGQMPFIQKQNSFGNIDLYKVDLKTNISNFIFFTNKSPIVNSYKWGNLDKAYSIAPNYIASSRANWNLFYPFRNLFSGKNEENKEFTLDEKGGYLEFSNDLQKVEGSRINIPSALSGSGVTAVQFEAGKNSNGYFLISANIKTPKIFLDNKKIWGQTISKPLFLVPQDGPRQFSINFNSATFPVDLNNIKKDIGSTYASPNGNNIVILSPFSNFQIDLNPDISSLQNEAVSISLNDSAKKIRVLIPQVTDKYLSFMNTPDKNLEKRVKDCESFRKGTVSSVLENGQLSLDSKNSTACLSFYIASLPHEQGYAISVENHNIEGKPLHFWVLNEDQKSGILDTYLKSDKNASESNFVIPPYEQFGQGYSLNFENIAIGDETKNSLGKISLYPIPYDFLTSIVFTKNNSLKIQSNYETPQAIHPNESLYITNAPIDLDPEAMIVLSQSYDPGWNAYAVKNDNIWTRLFPFLLGKRLNQHYLINNWENGFVGSPDQINTRIIIVYLPQYLEYIGFILLLGLPLFFLPGLNLRRFFDTITRHLTLTAPHK